MNQGVGGRVLMVKPKAKKPLGTFPRSCLHKMGMFLSIKTVTPQQHDGVAQKLLQAPKKYSTFSRLCRLENLYSFCCLKHLRLDVQHSVCCMTGERPNTVEFDMKISILKKSFISFQLF
jgi:hypothetical protein